MTWEIETRPNWYCIYDEMGWYVAGCQSERQAQLIANAPQMLAALEDIVALGPPRWPNQSDILRTYSQCKEIARAAIAAVKGEGGENYT